MPTKPPAVPVIPVILSGGSGTRLWPLSDEARPKQFLSLITERSLLQETLLRTVGLDERVGPPIVVCNERHRFLVAEQLREIGAEPASIVLEREGRNTAPAVAVAAMLAQRAEAGIDPILLVLPADQVVRDAQAFRTALQAAIEAASEEQLVTFGIVPNRPETGYGYVRRGEPRGAWSVLEEFVEKPDLGTAERYVKSGQYLWNSGMFVFKASAYLQELERFVPEILEACRLAVAGAQVDEDFTRLGPAFFDCPADSIDYAVMEKTDRAAVVALDAGWSDVGSWVALHEVLDKDSDGNLLRGRSVNEACRNSYIESNSRLVAAIGLDGVIVVETEQAVLVMSATHSQELKRLVDRLKTDEDA